MPVLHRSSFVLRLTAIAGLAAGSSAFATTNVPVYNSLPGAFAKLYLDFDGDITPTWTPTYSPGTTPAYSIDADTTDFSDAELNNIHEIWSRVAEKYSPFKVNVTTVDPGNLNDLETMRIVIGGDGAWAPAGSGGIAVYSSFAIGGANFPNTGFVFPGHLGNGHPKFVAESSAHEAGHGFGLKHQSLFNASHQKILEYNSGDADRAPIMGRSYESSRGLWWKGSSTDGYTIIQDDMNNLSASGSARNNFGYRVDDHGSTLAAADPLSIDPEFSLDGAGIIEQTTDADFFSFTTPGGSARIFAEVAPFGPMLDLSMSLYDTAGNLLATSATLSLGEMIGYALDPGTYKIGIFSAENYGDVGQYVLSGSVVPEPASAIAALLAFTPFMGRRRFH